MYRVRRDMGHHDVLVITLKKMFGFGNILSHPDQFLKKRFYPLKKRFLPLKKRFLKLLFF